MGANSGEDALQRETVWMAHLGEKTLVAIRMRLLNEKEIACYDLSDWECVNHNTIVYKNMIPERSPFPSTFTFGEECFSSISKHFSYGQTSSGKTYTMRRITNRAVTDIYQCMERVICTCKVNSSGHFQSLMYKMVDDIFLLIGELWLRLEELL
ncbi:hypothetical protein RJ641_028950 [Dillenia turbinata]|uniref:Kinesin motor domain-containing protein n=1 Tax=Dillenia turbinata TaxID=194707 RepID=A0AAN8ZFV1_9MAGN